MNRTMTFRPRLLATCAAGTLLLTACAADAADVDNAAGGAAADSPTVRLAANPWPSSYGNAHVAKILLEEQMGVNVEVVEIDHNAQWAGMDSGEIDAVLEVWTTGSADPYATYVEDLGTVEDVGELGVIGRIGWFMPAYVLEDHPEFATWEGIKGNEEVFATAETAPSGQFLAADPSFDQYDEHIIANLGLDLEVVQSGSEAAQLTAVEAAIENREPLLFYFYEPHWMFAEHDLVMVELPEHTDECYDGSPEEIDCDYPDDELYKIVRTDLANEAPDVYEFVRNFEMTNDWQNEIALRMDVEDQEPQEAAQWWVDEHEDVWQAWLP